MNSDEPISHCAHLCREAEAQAKALGQSFIGTEHLLLALLDRRDHALENTLTQLGADVSALTAFVQEMLTAAGPSGLPGPPRPTPALRRVLERLGGQARVDDQPPVAMHVLLALASETDSPAAVLLEEAGLTLEVLRAEGSR